MLDMINHPEYNSTLILRAEVEFDHPISSLNDLVANGKPFSPPVTSLDIWGTRPLRIIRRRLLARRPHRDPSLLQDCTFFDRENASMPAKPSKEATLCILSPLLQEAESLPYYHPRVKHIAFRYVQDSVSPSIRIEVIPLEANEISFPVGQDCRLYRTCLALLDALHRYGLGRLNNYKKRVLHDQIISREVYQDLYLIMRERHKNLVKTWQEVTDPLKHVYEVCISRRNSIQKFELVKDIGIATYLMLLWKESFKGTKFDSNPLPDGPGSLPWVRWSRPPGGFVDIGCGNGLLVHILNSEGYSGFGFDIRSRTSWSHYPKSTQANLRTTVFDPSHLELNPEAAGEMLIPMGAFIIANHADELTPWTPIMATTSSASGYLSIPCCAWMFDRKFNREQAKSSYGDLPDDQLLKLNLGEEGLNSSYARYRIWLATISWQAGWEIECDTLRIPSTRNWAIVGEWLPRCCETVS
jgi:tRNASer (uridine44-2'-O)-methyltransferase